MKDIPNFLNQSQKAQKEISEKEEIIIQQSQSTHRNAI
jgi:hypothetical protein